MPRVNWVFLILALAGVGGGAALWLARANEAAHLIWTAATAVAFLPLVVRVSKSLVRRESGVDLIAVLAMVGALLLGEALAGAVIGLMLASGQSNRVALAASAILGGATPEQEEAAGTYGRNLGMAFQIVDDVLDLTASESVLGKPVASDLREGKVTMAVIYALERCTPAEREKIATILRERAFNGVRHADILEILNRYEALEAANAKAAQYADAARRAICTFPDTEIKRALLWAPEFVIAREK